MRGWKVAWMMSEVYRHAWMFASIFYPRERKPLGWNIVVKLV